MHLRSRFKTHALHAFTALCLFVCGSLGFSQADVSAWPQVSMTFFALDAKGNPLPGLTAKDLELKEDGRTQTLSAVSQTSAPESVCILVDASASMHDRLIEVKAAAARLMRGLPPGDEVCLMDFSTTASVDAPLTIDRAAAIDSMKILKASGGTALYDAVTAASRFMRKSARFDRRSIILLTDGDDNYSQADESAMLAELRLNGSPVVHAIRIPSQRAQNKATIVLDDISAHAGLTYFPRDQDELTGAVDNLNVALRERYELQFRSAEPLADGRKRHVALRLAGNGRKEGALLRAPEVYHAPSQ